MFISNKTNIEIYTVYAEENDKETIRESRNVDGSKQKNNHLSLEIKHWITLTKCWDKDNISRRSDDVRNTLTDNLI